MDLLTRLRSKGRTIAGYGASGRANTIIQYCGIGRDHLEYMIDDAPAKHGYSTPGSHLLIRSNEVLRTRPAGLPADFCVEFLQRDRSRRAGTTSRKAGD